MAEQNDEPQPETPDFSFLNTEPSADISREVASTSRAGTERSRRRVNTGPNSGSPQKDTADHGPGPQPFASRRFHLYVTTYALTLTMLVIILLATGRLQLFGRHPLESLPDIRPLDSNEFQQIPVDVPLPSEHALQLGESRRFGDVVLRPLKVTREPLQFVGFLDGQSNSTLTTQPVLKLWIEFTNVADDYAFPPYDSGLMSWRWPAEETDQAAQTISANSFLKLLGSGGDIVGESDSIASDSGSGRRILNFLHSLDSNFIISDQNSGKVLMPGESLLTFIACSEEIVNASFETQRRCIWRVHFRKGVHVSTGHGVTTLVDIHFRASEIETTDLVQRETPGRNNG